MSEDRGARRPRSHKPRRKVCAFCVDKIEYIDYKEFRDVNSRMRRNINERGKIMPRRMKRQLRPSISVELSEAIKRARAIALRRPTPLSKSKRLNQASSRKRKALQPVDKSMQTPRIHDIIRIMIPG